MPAVWQTYIVGARKAGPAVGIGLLIALTVCLTAWAAPLRIDESIELIQADSRGNDGQFTFVVLGDSQSVDIVYLPVLEQILDDDPVFILHAGDVTFSGSEQEFEHYQELIADYPIPIVHVAGNHDIVSGPANFPRYVGDSNWEFEFGGCRFIGLDNSSGAFDTETIMFAGYAIDPSMPSFLIFHHPPHYDRWEVHAMVADEDGGNGGLIARMIRQGNVQGVFSGHLHLFDQYIYSGTPHIISGGAGATLYRTRYGLSERGYVVVSVRDYGNNVSFQWTPLRVELDATN